MRRLPGAVWLGGAVLAAVVLLALLGPWIEPYPFDEFDVVSRLAPPSLLHWCGTDEFGRDVLSRLMHGAAYSLAMGFGATAISLTIGLPLGLVAAYCGGLVSAAIMRLIDLLIAMPPILLGLLVLAVTSPSAWKTTLAVGLIYVPIMTRLARAVALGLVAEDFTLAARARGDGPFYILFSELLPNAWPPIIVECGLRVTFAILLGSALSFLGLGSQPPASDWGLMISDARPFLDDAPWLALAPGLALCVVLVAVNLLGDGLRQTLDPRLLRRAA